MVCLGFEPGNAELKAQIMAALTSHQVGLVRFILFILSTTQHASPSFMLKVLERVGSNMAPTISNFLIEFTKNRSYYQMSPSSLLHYLDANLIFLKSNLVPENFKRVLSVIWSTSAASLSSIIHEAIGRFFALFKNYHMTCLLFCVPNHLYPSFR